MIGEYLRSQRERASLTLKDISEKTRIRTSYLHAIEEENFDKIPGRVFIKGYVRQYCNALSIPEKEAIEILDADLREYYKPEEPPVKEDRGRFIPIKILYPIAVLLVVAVIGLYFNAKENHGPQIAKKQANTEITKTSTQNMVAQKKEDTSNKESSIDNNIKIPTPLGTAEADYAGKHILEVETMKETWVFINIDKKLKYSMILKPGEVRSWSGKNSFFMRVGNAGGIRITYDGQSLGSPGRMGEVVSLTLPDELERFKLNTKEQE
jgi:cytoskeletal protein RodZ